MTAQPFVFGLTLLGDGRADSRATFEDDGRPRWLHLDYAQPGIEENLAELGLDELTVDSLTRTETRPRALVHDEALLANLRGINTNPDEDPDDMVSLRLWLSGTTLISVRQRRLASVQQVRQALVEGDGPTAVGALVVAIVESMTDRISEFCESIETRVQALEDDDRPDVRSELRLLRRQLARVRRFLSPQRDAIEAMARLGRGPLSEDERFALREQADRTARYVEDLDLLRERAQMLQDERVNLLAAQQGARMYLLSLVTAVFLPMSFVTGVMGMNVGGLPGVESDLGFTIVAGLMIGLGAAIIIALRLWRWF